MEHHAYVYEGLRTFYPLLLSDARTRFAFTELDNPDVYTGEWDTFGIDEVRDVIERASLKSVSGKSLFVIGASVITTQAQQALLKLSEEPNSGIVLILLVPSGTLIPALRSRFALYPTILTEVATREGKTFLHLSLSERSKAITELLKEDEGVRDSVRHLLQSIEEELHPLLTTRKEVRDALTEISLVRSYLSDQGASLKLLLEHLSLMLPIL